MNPYDPALIFGKPYFYILDAEGNVKATDIMTWAEVTKGVGVQIADTTNGSVRVSTVFTGMDMGMTLDGPPLLFETMVFGGPHDHATCRYYNKAAALAGHQEMYKQATAYLHN